MSQDRELNLALFIDFDNVALGARDARQRFDIKLLMHRVLEKGKVIVKRAYADWHYYKEHMNALHEAAIELIEVPMPRISGKNSADIKMVVDAMDLCYSKDHIDAFVLVTGDSDFSPLVSKLRENDKRVIGIGMKNSSSKLLIGNCDEFIFYDDIYRQVRGSRARPVPGIPGEKGELYGFLVETVQSLLQESRGALYGSLIKDTMTRKKPDFNERSYGFSTFGDLLEEARRLGLLEVERDAKAGGTWVVQGLGPGSAQGAAEGSSGGSRSSRRRRRSGDRNGRRDRSRSQDGAVAADSASDNKGAVEDAKAPAAPDKAGGEARAGGETPAGEQASAASATGQGEPAESGPEKTTERKPVTKKKTTAKKTTAKKTAKKTATKKATTKKATTKKKTAKKTTTKKKTAKKAVTKKKTTKKTATKKTTARKTTAQKGGNS